MEALYTLSSPPVVSFNIGLGFWEMGVFGSGIGFPDLWP